jgi:hypothetical protein
MILEMVLVVAVLAVVGLGIYTGAQHKSSPPVSAKTTPIPSKSAPPSPTPTPTKPANELDVPELGIKMTLPAGLTGVHYSAQVNQQGTAGKNYLYSTAQFSATTLEQADNSANCQASAGPLGVIAKYDFDPTGLIGGINKVVKVNNFYLTFTGAQAPCSLNSSVEKLQSSQMQLMIQAFSTVSAK